MPPAELNLEWSDAPKPTVLPPCALITDWRADEQRRDDRLPLSRWYIRPLGTWLAVGCAKLGVTPCQVTWLGAGCFTFAALLIAAYPQTPQYALPGLLLGWLCDRTDGQLARLTRQATAGGAWLDANLDELVDLVLHCAFATAAYSTGAGPLAWGLLIAFIAGKYLLMHGLSSEKALTASQAADTHTTVPANNAGSRLRALAGRLYHFPAVADVRFHLVLIAVVTGWFTWELALVAAYYNLRWIARLVWVPTRLDGGAP